MSLFTTLRNRYPAALLFGLALCCLLLGTSCSKSDSGGDNCYICSFSSSSGEIRPDSIICAGGSSPQPVLYDSQGNKFDVRCSKR